VGSPSSIANRVLLGWECDICGAPITSAEDGWVEWLADVEGGVTQLAGVNLVHRSASQTGSATGNGCQYDARLQFHLYNKIVEGLPLARFLGPDGLMFLLSLLFTGEIPLSDFMELTKRVQIPGYERIRPILPRAERDGIITPSIGSGFYLQGEIRTVLTWAGTTRS
jgi:hypothetical protein